MKEHTDEFLANQEKTTYFYKDIGINIKNARERNGYDQEYMADKLNLSIVTIRNIESGKQRLSIHYLSAISEILKTTLDSLIPVFKL